MALLCAGASACADGPRARPAPLPAGAPAEAHAVAQVVAGILGYARWPMPPSPEPPLLCVTGASPYSAALLAGNDAMAGLRARRVAPGEPDLAQTCDALYIGELPPYALARLLRSLIGRPVVSILEQDPDCDAGGMFCLEIQGGQVGFLVNLDIVARSGVRIHPSVLQLARRKPPA